MTGAAGAVVVRVGREVVKRFLACGVGMTELEKITCVEKYGFPFSRKPRLNARQGGKIGNVFYMLRERGTNAASGGVSECSAL